MLDPDSHNFDEERERFALEQRKDTNAMLLCVLLVWVCWTIAAVLVAIDLSRGAVHVSP